MLFRSPAKPIAETDTWVWHVSGTANTLNFYFSNLPFRKDRNYYVVVDVYADYAKTERVLGTGDFCPVSGGGSSMRKADAKLVSVVPVVSSLLTAGDDGKELSLCIGQTVEVRLDGNPTTGFSWAVGTIDGDAVSAVGDPIYTPSATGDGIVGSGGTYSFVFMAEKAGAAKVTLTYRRPWETDSAPAQTFTFSVTVPEPTPIPCFEVYSRVELSPVK